MEQNDPQACEVNFIGLQRDALIKITRNFATRNQMNAESGDRRKQRANGCESDKSPGNWHPGRRQPGSH